jgi:hypothetical protein
MSTCDTIGLVLAQGGFSGIEITTRGNQRWTLSGEHKVARAASEWLVAQGYLQWEFKTPGSNFLRDSELDETFVYLREPPFSTKSV